MRVLCGNQKQAQVREQIFDWCSLGTRCCQTNQISLPFWWTSLRIQKCLLLVSCKNSAWELIESNLSDSCKFQGKRIHVYPNWHALIVSGYLEFWKVVNQPPADRCNSCISNRQSTISPEHFTLLPLGSLILSAFFNEVPCSCNRK